MNEFSVKLVCRLKIYIAVKKGTEIRGKWWVGGSLFYLLVIYLFILRGRRSIDVVGG